MCATGVTVLCNTPIMFESMSKWLGARISRYRNSDCPICGESKKLTKVPVCGHSLCSLCLERSVRGDMEIGRMTQCPLCLSKKDPNYLLSYELRSIRVNETIIREVESAEFRRATVNMTFCGNCQNPFEKENTARASNCPYCKQDPYLGSDANAERSFAKYREEAGTFPCYKCGQGLELKEACNKLQCRCGAKVCWWCTRPINDVSYHFRRGGCPLYVRKGMVLPRLTQKVSNLRGSLTAALCFCGEKARYIFEPVIVWFATLQHLQGIPRFDNLFQNFVRTIKTCLS